MNKQTKNPFYFCKELENPRVRRQLLSYLSTKEYPLDINIIHDPVLFMDNLMDYACSKVSSIIRRDNNINTWVKLKVYECRAELLPESEFDWLKRDERACYYTWLTLQGRVPFIRNLTNLALEKKGNWLSYDDLQLSTLTESTQKRLDLIIGYFDLQPVCTLDKINYLKHLHRQWNDSFERNPFKWLDRKDTNACKWGYDYIKSIINKTNTKDNNRQKTSRAPFKDCCHHLSELNPTTADEQYQFIYAFFDILDEPDKKDLKEKISKKFAQYKYRENNKDDPPLNTRMTKETKKQLEKLRKHYKTNLQDTIEHIIQLAYDHEIVKSNVIKVDFSKKD